MKNLIIYLVAIMGITYSANASVVNSKETNNNTTHITYASSDEAVTSVRATLVDGSMEKHFTVFRRELPNGKYRYYVTIGNQEYTVFWANEYNCFAVQANALWLFRSKSLEYQFFSYNKKAYNAR